jgi:hypothetical protein
MRVERLVSISWPAERREGGREREAVVSDSIVTKFLPERELTELHLMKEIEFLFVRTEFPFATVNILT